MKNLDNSDFGDKSFDIMSSFTCSRKGMRIRHCTEGLLVYDGCEWKKVEGSNFDSGKWRDWTFELNGRAFKGDELLQLD
jgi:hypothetical protein